MLRNFFNACMRLVVVACLAVLAFVLFYVFSQIGFFSFLLTMGLVILLFGLGAMAAIWVEGR